MVLSVFVLLFLVFLDLPPLFWFISKCSIYPSLSCCWVFTSEVVGGLLLLVGSSSDDCKKFDVGVGLIGNTGLSLNSIYTFSISKPRSANTLFAFIFVLISNFY